MCVFFFQAEDGIRDGHVTGVQTCALPIYPTIANMAQTEEIKSQCFFGLAIFGGATASVAISVTMTTGTLMRNTDPHQKRSEERRVGKECRARRETGRGRDRRRKRERQKRP